MVIRALAGPFTGAPAIDSGTGSCSTRLACLACRASCEFSISCLMAAAGLLAFAAATAMAASELLCEQGGSSTRHCATFIGQPQVQSKPRIASSAAAFCAGVTPVQSTPGKSVIVRQPCANTNAALSAANAKNRISLLWPMEIQIKVLPRAAKTEFAGEMADGTLKLRVKAVPEDGKANEELLSFLARHYGVARQSVQIGPRATSQRKRIRIQLADGR